MLLRYLRASGPLVAEQEVGGDRPVRRDVGDDERRINLLDANGVNVVAIQALYRRVVALEGELNRLSPEWTSPAHGAGETSSPSPDAAGGGWEGV